ncbi:MAG: glutamate formimidoyltransferase [Bacteroidia bacterium]|nr:glutamate formimidoyltransferase [Bacteroidia bacterium]
MKKIIECVPNFSEGRDANVIREITDQIEAIDGVKLLNVDPGKATNRTVVTFVGEPEKVIDAAFAAIKKAAEVIDMTKHSGEHPRMGATDVCPLVPVANVSMEEAAEYAQKLAKRVGEELNIPIYLYEAAQKDPKRKNLSVIRAGEYEGFAAKIKKPEWKPDFGPAVFNERAGATVIGARDFLIAYNVNLNTKSVKRANSIAFDVREAGRLKREGDPISGKVVKDADGKPMRDPGKLKGVKGIGWYIDEYEIAQVSLNITRFKDTPLHQVFEECVNSATERGMRVTGSELIGLVPLSAMVDAGRYFLGKMKLSRGVSEKELVHIAIKSMGLDELGEFDPQERIIEYQLAKDANTPLINMKLNDFTDETASDSPAPGGGSISAYVGSLGASLATMVANLSAIKKGWYDRWEEFSEYADAGQKLKVQLNAMVDEDTKSFNAIMDAFRMPKASEAVISARKKAISDATKYAIQVPYQVMEISLESMKLAKSMAENGNPNSVSDAGVGALCCLTAVKGAFLNVKINTADFDDSVFVDEMMKKGNAVEQEAIALEREIMEIVERKIKGE